MVMHFIVQSPALPERVLSALEDMAEADLTEVRFSVSYVTASGVEILVDRIARKLGGARWAKTRKGLVTCTDYGITEPEALRQWLALPAASILLQNAHLIGTGALDPAPAFHAKVYEFRSAARANLLVGSANLSERALTSNTEAAIAHTGISNLAGLDAAWAAFGAGAVVADAALIGAYEAARAGKTPPPPPPVAAPLGPPARSLWDAVSNGACAPEGFEYFWVQAGYLSGGSRNQLELPRGANRFFGFGFADYHLAQVQIGQVDLAVRATFHADRPLSWHDDNGMERLNLPTGQAYAGNVMLFRRRPGRFELTWAPLKSDRARAWAAASQAAGHRYRLGQRGERTCGLF